VIPALSQYVDPSTQRSHDESSGAAHVGKRAVEDVRRPVGAADPTSGNEIVTGTGPPFGWAGQVDQATARPARRHLAALVAPKDGGQPRATTRR
jgi:hypothetical protein